jgi:hypothetical protein
MSTLAFPAHRVRRPLRAYADAGGGGDSSDLLVSGYWKGPGGWVYWVSGPDVTVVWSPITRSTTIAKQDRATATEILAELRASKDAKVYTSRDAAVAAAQVDLQAQSTPAAPTTSSTEVASGGRRAAAAAGGGRRAAAAAAAAAAAGGTTEVPLWQNPWVVGGGIAVLVVGIGVAVLMSGKDGKDGK